MSGIQRFAVRSNGRDLSLVRRPLRPTPRAAKVIAAVAEQAPVVKTETLDPAELNKADLSNLAVAVGVDSSGTKPEVLKRVEKKTK